MPDEKIRTEAPLDLSAIGAEESLPAVQARAAPPAAAIPPMPAPERLVGVGTLPSADLDEARARAQRIDFRDTLSLLNHAHASQGALAAVSRQLLADRTVGQAGEVGAIAAAVLDGIKILRIEDIQRESVGDVALKKGGLLSRVIGFAHDAGSAIRGFAENRRRFLALMDAEEARARRTQADLTAGVAVLDAMGQAARHGIHELKLDIAAAQIALDRGYEEAEALRQRALAAPDAMAAAELSADVMEYRASLANFAGKAGELRTALIKAATLIPTIGNTKRAAEIRIMKISTGLLAVIPNLMAAAALAMAQADVRGAAEEAERLAEADRRVTALASRGAHDAAIAAARSLGADPRNVAVLAQVVQDQVGTLREILAIEQDFARKDSENERQLVEVRDALVTGMQAVQRRAVSTAARPA
jgi:uncharacterized protein YaaN involved in tellurite resistance